MSDSGLLNTAECAELLHVDQTVIRQWRKRGHLPVAGLDDHGRPLHRPQDATAAEARTRARAKRTPHVLPT